MPDREGRRARSSSGQQKFLKYILHVLSSPTCNQQAAGDESMNLQDAILKSVDLPAAIGFSVGAFLAWIPVSAYMRYSYVKHLKEMLESKRQRLQDHHSGTTLAEFGQNLVRFEAQILETFDLDFAQEIGTLERTFYVFSVISGQYALLAGWLVMKAFFAWIQIPANTKINLPNPSEWQMLMYHSYLWGSGRSLMFGMLCGIIGQCVRSFVTVYWFSAPQ